jgi:hypothetical protein
MIEPPGYRPRPSANSSFYMRSGKFYYAGPVAPRSGSESGSVHRPEAVAGSRDFGLDGVTVTQFSRRTSRKHHDERGL